MSFFYLTPVKGDLPIHLLETIILKRLEFLKIIYRKQEIIYNEYVVEGSLYDSVGHFMLCVIVILLNNLEFTNFFTKAEEFLFKHRLNTLVAYDLRCFVKKLLRIIRKYPHNLLCLDPLKIVCQHLILKHVAQHVCSDACNTNCSLHTIKVHFRHCLAFIARRQVPLEHSVAHIPCSKWKMYLAVLFKDNLKNRLSKTNLGNLEHDPRIADLMSLVCKEIPSINNRCSVNIVKNNEVDDICKSFPPCMINLHRSLRNKHRLSHNQRFSYSLFLKDIGMPVEEAITFWKTEYQQAPSGNHNCCHNWQNDEKKFVYGIRHLYGLEGGKKNYSSRSCSHFQSFTEGSCPFKSFDNESMMHILNIKNIDPMLSQIKNFQEQKQYTSACMMYLQKRLHCVLNDICDSSFNFSPVKYYFASRNALL